MGKYVSFIEALTERLLALLGKMSGRSDDGLSGTSLFLNHGENSIVSTNKLKHVICNLFDSTV